MAHFLYLKLTKVLIPLLLSFSTISILSACGSSTPNVRPALEERPQQWAKAINTQWNLYKIDDGIYRSEQPQKENNAQIETLGIKTIINLRAFHSDDGIITDPSIHLVRIPTHTWNIQDEQIIAALSAITEGKKKGAVLIHCQHGADRTGLVSAMYRVIYQNWSKEAALAELTNGGYNFHPMWTNIIQYMKDVDPQAIRKQLKAQSTSLR